MLYTWREGDKAVNIVICLYPCFDVTRVTWMLNYKGSFDQSDLSITTGCEEPKSGIFQGSGPIPEQIT